MRLLIRPTGMAAFIIVWLGQLVSLTGTAMTWFALTIWVWQTTGEATALATLSFFAFLPPLLFSPLAGALVDRWNRKLVMLFSDLGSGLATFVVFLLYVTGNMQLGYLYLVGLFVGSLTAFQFPSYSAAVTMMLPKEHYARAEGMLGLAQAASGVLAPLFAASLLGLIGIFGIMLIDLLTYLVALGALLWVHIPQPPVTAPEAQTRRSLWREALYGFRYILERPGLRVLQLIFLVGNFFEGFALALIAPMLLARTGNDELLLGSVQSIGAIGGIVGGALISIWGGPKRKMRGVLFGWALSNVLGLMLMGLGNSFAIWALASFFFAFFTPIVNGSDQSIWQSKVSPEVQGRVFSIKLSLIQIPALLAMLFAGPLADQVFEPAMRPGGYLAAAFGWLVADGPGAGMALMLVLASGAGLLFLLGSYASQTVRNVEDLFPDHNTPVL